MLVNMISGWPNEDKSKKGQ